MHNVMQLLLLSILFQVASTLLCFEHARFLSLATMFFWLWFDQHAAEPILVSILELAGNVAASYFCKSQLTLAAPSEPMSLALN